ncbi:MAG: FAD-binding protein, partial [Raoultibacter sp.]
ALGGATADTTVEELSAMAPSIDKAFVPKMIKKWNAFREWIFDQGAPNITTIYDVMISIGSSYAKRKEFFDYFKEEIEGSGSSILLNTRAIQLCTDEGGAVCGAIAVDAEGTAVRIRANSVILATGGFSANDEMRGRYFGFYGDNIVGRVVPFNQGDGHRMAIELGAQLTKGMGQFYGHLVPYPSVIPQNAEDYAAASKDDLNTALGTIQLIMGTGFLVNLDGKRFADESSALHIMPMSFDSSITVLMGSQPYGIGYAIFDSSVEATVDGISSLEGVGAVIDKADTLDALGAALSARGVREAAFARTVAEFNGVQNPSDLEVRSTAREQGTCTPLLQPPFYAVQVTGGASGMFGGLRINEGAHVLGYGDVPIPNLYATACCAGGFSYDEYIGSLATSSVVGIMAVEEILGKEVLV